MQGLEEAAEKYKVSDKEVLDIINKSGKLLKSIKGKEFSQASCIIDHNGNNPFINQSHIDELKRMPETHVPDSPAHALLELLETRHYARKQEHNQKWESAEGKVQRAEPAPVSKQPQSNIALC